MDHPSSNSGGMQMVCLLCFKVIRIDQSLLAADFSMLGINRLAALSTRLQAESLPSAESARGSLDDSSFTVCDKCEAANEPSFHTCAACGHPSRLGRMSSISAGKHRLTQSSVNLHQLMATGASTPQNTDADSPSAVPPPLRTPDLVKHGGGGGGGGSVDNFRLRTATLLRNSSPSGVGNRLTLLGKVSNLFIEASALHGIDQPLCKDCFRKTDKLLQSRVSDLRIKATMLRSALADLVHQPLESADENALDAELAALEADVRGLESERDQLACETRDWSMRAEAVRELAAQAESARDLVLQQLLVKQDAIGELVSALAFYSALQQKLSRAMPLSDIFHIWFDGHFGTICAYRLGRLASVPVEWAEINAAWGMCALLLQSLAHSMALKFREWEPVPVGVTSRMRNLAEDSLYELNFSSELSLGRVFWYRKFDYAICGFLQCVHEIVAHVAVEDPSFVFPYVIERDKIGPAASMISVRYQFADETEWTRAMKYLLTMLKFATAWLAKKRLDLKSAKPATPRLQ